MASSKTLQDLRNSIDEIDRKILELVNERGRIALEVSGHKKENSLSIYDPAREKQIEKKIKETNPGPLSDSFVISIFREIISGCRALQKPTRIAYLGPEGSFSNQAAFHNFGSSSALIPVSNFEEVFEVVQKGRAEFGIVPVENSVEGSIGSILDMLLEWDLKICAEYYERIGHFLLSISGNIEEVVKVASHPQALGQCRKWLGKNLENVEYIETPSTAAAARMAAEDSKIAAVAGEYAASLYGLEIIQSHIEDSTQNTTRFIIIGYKTPPPTGEDKTSVVFAIKDKPGALHKSLFLPFANANINLTKIESRPSKSRPWEYVFFVDFIGHQEDEKVQAVLQEVEKSCIFLKILGSYPLGQSK